MSKWNMIVDVAKCTNCHNCFVTAKDEHVGNDFPGYAAPQPLHGHQWIDMKRHERGTYPVAEANFMPVMCNHCDDAPCIKAATNGAAYKREDGIVMLDPQKAKGQRQIVDSCPYGAVFWNDELQIPQKWIFDAHLLDAGWTKTRAEQVCATGALKSVKVEDQEMATIAAREQLEVLMPQLGTKPRVWYKNLHLMRSAFVAGTVVTTCDDVEECVAGATIILKKDGHVAGQAVSDAFGEFKIDHLAPDSGTYTIQVQVTGRPDVVRDVNVSASVYAGVIAV